MIISAYKFSGESIDVNLLGSPGFRSSGRVNYVCDICSKLINVRIDTLLRTNSIEKQICEKCLAVKVRIKNPYEPYNSKWKLIKRGIEK